MAKQKREAAGTGKGGQFAPDLSGKDKVPSVAPKSPAVLAASLKKEKRNAAEYGRVEPSRVYDAGVEAKNLAKAMERLPWYSFSEKREQRNLRDRLEDLFGKINWADRLTYDMTAREYYDPLARYMGRVDRYGGYHEE
jgi:hypothetical protein